MKNLVFTILLLCYTFSFSQEKQDVLSIFNSNISFEQSIDSVIANNKQVYNNSPEWQQKLFNKILKHSKKSLKKK